MSLLDDALIYRDTMGWTTTPLSNDDQGYPKKPFVDGWQREVLGDVPGLPWEQAVGIGIVLGKASGDLAVLDLDDVELAEHAAHAYSGHYFVRTARGRGHLYVRETEGPSASRAVKVQYHGRTVGIELKATGTQVAAPPSPGYGVWNQGPVLRATSVQSAFADLCTLCGIEPPAATSPAGYPPPWQESVPDGDRNNAQYVEACRLAEARMPEGEAIQVMRARFQVAYEKNPAKDRAGDRAMVRTIRSAYARVEQERRTGSQVRNGQETEPPPGGTASTTYASSAEPAAPFPLHALPEPLRSFCEQAARSIVMPPDYAALPLLAAAGGAIGNAREIALGPDWREGPNLYVASVGETGTKKTPGEQAALKATARVQTRLHREYTRAKAAFEQALATWEAAPDKKERGAKPAPPRYPHLFTTDATSEALVPMLQHAKGLLLWRDELVGWVKAMDQYKGGHGADRQNYLSAWSRGPMKVDRKSSDEPFFVAKPCLSVFGGIQPDLLPDLGDAARRDDGFIERVGFGWPDPVPDHLSDEPIDPAVAAQVDRIYEALYALEPDRDAEGEASPRTLPLTAEANAAWHDWYADHAREMAAEDFPRHLRGAWAKMPSQLGRHALIIHCIRAVAGAPLADEIDDRSFCMAAILVEEYFKPHAKRVWGLLIRAHQDIGPRMLGYIVAQGGRAKQSDIFRHPLGGNVPASKMLRELERYEVEEVLRREQPPHSGPGRPPIWWILGNTAPPDQRHGE